MKPSFLFFLATIIVAIVPLVSADTTRLRVHAVKQFSATTCSTSEESLTDSYISAYDVSDCDTSSCTTACLDSYTSLYIVLPDCEYSDGTNYFAAVSDAWDACYDSLYGTSWSTTDNSCTETQESTILEAYSTYYTGACDGGDCTDACVTDLNNLYAAFPDCMSSDGVNYFDTTGSALSYCSTQSTGTTADSSTTTPTSDSDTATGSLNSLTMQPSTSTGSPSSRFNSIQVAVFIALTVSAVLW